MLNLVSKNRRLILVLIVLYTFALSLNYKLNEKRQARAAGVIEKWGPHIKDWFDPDDPKTLDTIRNAHDQIGNRDIWIPFTVMIPGAENETERAHTTRLVQGLVNQAAVRNMVPIIRITSKLCSDYPGWEAFTNDYATNTAAALNAVNVPALADSVYVEWGNEVNLGLEWGNRFPSPQGYGNSLDTFKTALTNPKFKIMKSSLNTSNPNTQDAMDAEEYYTKLGQYSSSILSGISTIASHPYEVLPGAADRYTVNAWKYDYNKSIAIGASTSSNIILTEFGLAPSRRTPPDNDPHGINFVKKSYQDGLYSNEPRIKFITPLLLADGPGGDGSTKVIVFGDDGATAIIDQSQTSGGTSLGGGECVPPLQDPNNNSACLVEDYEPTPDDVCTLKGKVSKVYRTEDGKRIRDATGIYEDEGRGIEGLGIAWIDRPLNSEDDEDPTNATYNFTTVKKKSHVENGVTIIDYEYELKNIGCGAGLDKTTFIGVFCNDEILETNSIEWEKVGNYQARMDINVPKNVTCSSNNYCVRPSIDTTEIACEQDPTPEPEYKEAKYISDKPQSIQQSEPVNWLLDIIPLIAQCLASPQCLQEGIEFVLGGDNTLEVKETNLDWQARRSIMNSHLGPLPKKDPPTCEEIKNLNKNASGIGITKRGTWFLTHSPTQINKMCTESQINGIGNKPACDLNGEIISLHQIAPPAAKAGELTYNGQSYILPKEYFRYDLCGQAEHQRNDDGMTHTKAKPRLPNLSEDDTCGGPYRNNPDGTQGCDIETGPTADGDIETPVITRAGNSSIVVSEKITSTKGVPLYFEPGKDDIASDGVTSSGISKVKMFGRECTCPKVDRDPPGAGDNDPYVCKKGGTKFRLREFISVQLAIEKRTHCAQVPQPADCTSDSISKTESGVIKYEAPWFEEIGNSIGKICDITAKPGAIRMSTGTIGTTKANQFLKGRIPFRLEGGGTGYDAEKCINERLSPPEKKIL